MENFRKANALDLELTCHAEGKFPEGEFPEIIQIGLAEVDIPSLTITRKISLPVIPTCGYVSDYCTDLTGWTFRGLRSHGTTFKEACRRLSKNGTRKRTIITDTCDELRPFLEHCQRLGVENPFGGPFEQDVLNISTLMTLATRQRRNLSLQEKLARLKLTPFEGRQHRADDDAYNIARIYIRLMIGCQAGLSEFHRIEADEKSEATE